MLSLSTSATLDFTFSGPFEKNCLFKNAKKDPHIKFFKTFKLVGNGLVQFW